MDESHSRPAPDMEYTSSDHAFRSDDYYARVKYDITLKFLKANGLKSDAQILNIGCGAGLFNQLAAEAGFRVIGLEPDPEAFASARHGATERVQVFNVGIERIPNFPQVDALVLHDVLEHIEDDVEALTHAIQYLKPSGLVFISVPAMESLYGYHDELLGHFRRYSKLRLRKLMSTDLTEIYCRHIGFTGIPYVLWNSKIRRSTYSVVEKSSGGRQSLFKLVCTLEKYVRTPIGTSLLIGLRMGAKS